MKKVINLTPHEVVVLGEDGKTILATFPLSGKVARVATQRERVGFVNGITVYKATFGEVVDLPKPEVDTVYIVSILVLQASLNRSDLVAPDTTPQGVVRDAGGNIIGVKGFQVL